MSKKGTTTVYRTLTGGQGAHVDGQGITFGEENLEKETHGKRKKV